VFEIVRDAPVPTGEVEDGRGRQNQPNSKAMLASENLAAKPTRGDKAGRGSKDESGTVYRDHEEEEEEDSEEELSWLRSSSNVFAFCVAAVHALSPCEVTEAIGEEDGPANASANGRVWSGPSTESAATHGKCYFCCNGVSRSVCCYGRLPRSCCFLGSNAHLTTDAGSGSGSGPGPILGPKQLAIIE